MRPVLARFVCRRRGHVNTALMLPEDGWGLYAFSQLACSRCKRIEYRTDMWAELGRYNAERSRGVVHEPAFAARMAIQQEYFDELTAAEAFR